MSPASPPRSEPDRPDPSASPAGSYAPAVLRNSAIQIGGHVVAIGLTAAATIILTRFLDVDGYGRFTILTVFLLLGVTVSELGLNGTAVRWFSRGDRPEEIFASLLGLRLVLSTAAALVGLGIYAVYPDRGAPLIAAALTALGMVVAGVNLTIPTALQARLDFRLGVVLDLASRVVALATYALAAVLLTAPDADSRLVAAAVGLPAGYLVAMVIGLAAVRGLAFPIVPAFHPTTWRRLLLEALPLGIVSILGLASYRLDAVVLAVMQDATDVGIYGLAYRFMEAAVPLGAFIVAVVYPLLARDSSDDADGSERRALQIARAADLLLIVAVGASVATVVLAPDLVLLLGGTGYEPAVMPLRTLTLSLPFTFLSMLLMWALVARGMQRRLIPVALAAVAVNLSLNIALVPAYSYKASAAITLAMEAAGAAVWVVLVRRWLGASPSLPSTTRIAASGATALAAGLLLPVPGEVLAALVAVAVFVGLVLAFGLVTRAELDALMRRR